MSRSWYMLTVVGRDRPGIVARVTAALFEAGSNLGEASMLRVGGSFTIMLMVELAGDEAGLRAAMAPVIEALDLRAHVVPIQGLLHDHPAPDARVTVYGADRTGIVAEVTGALADAGFDILDLSSVVGGTAEYPIYVLHIEGRAEQGLERLTAAVARLSQGGGIDVRLAPIETLVG